MRSISTGGEELDWDTQKDAKMKVSEIGRQRPEPVLIAKKRLHSSR